MSFERIRKIENELETGQLQTRERSIIHDVKTPKVSDSWNTDSKLVTPTKEDSTIASSNWFRRLFILSIIFATIGGLVFVSAVFFSPQNVSDKNVIVSVNARSSVDGGESFSSTVIVTNKNKVPLEFVKIALQYPLVPGGDVSGLSQEVAIDSIAPGEIKEVPFTVSLYGSANTSRTLTAKVVYRVPGSVALFESISTTETLLRSSPMRLTIDAPSEVFPNQETTLTVTYASNLKNLSPSSMLRMSYPPGFRFMSADPKPDVDNHTWKVGTLLPGATNTISITGVLGGVLREEKIFSATLGSISATQTDFESIYATSVTPSVITPTFLALSLGTESLIASGNRYVISSHEQDFSINFKNTQNTSITRAKIRITFSGNIFNEQFSVCSLSAMKMQNTNNSSKKVRSAGNASSCDTYALYCVFA